MTTYKPETHHAAAAAGAVALSLLTLVTLVAVPAAHDGSDAAALVMARQAAPVEVTISPARIDVIAIRAPNVAWAMPEDGKPNCKPEV